MGAEAVAAEAVAAETAIVEPAPVEAETATVEAAAASVETPMRVSSWDSVFDLGDGADDSMVDSGTCPSEDTAA